MTRDEILRARPAVDLAEALPLVPGVFAQSGPNFAQDERLSIRGFGARAPFGVRGIKILVDGIPTTLPDGQSELDSIELAFVDNVEVVRGPISSLYGGGGGGIVSLSTVDPTDEPGFSLRALFGTHHLSRYDGIATGRAAGVGYVVGLAHTRYSGYRDHARAEQTNLLTKLEREFGDGTRVQLQLSSVSAPEAQDPGGLTAAEVDEDRSAAAPSARLFDTGERLDQQKVGLLVHKPLAPGRDLRLSGYYLERDFRNSLPFATRGRTRLDRAVGGGSAVYTHRWQSWEWTTGADVDVQKDRRSRYENDGGAYGELQLRQSETVRSVGLFAQAARDLGGGFGLTGGARYDWTEFVAGDRFTENGDQSSRIRMRELSPRIGVHFSRTPALFAYANLSGGFRVPTTTELAPTSLEGGFDTSLDPERILGLEVGAKGLLRERIFYDAVVFALRIRDALIPFQDSEGRNRARNAGDVRREGFELGISALLHPWLSLRCAYTYSHFRYRDFDVVRGGVLEEFDGNREPNIPEHNASAELRFAHPDGWFATLALRYFSDLETNDANTSESDGATIADFRAGYEWRRGAFVLQPFFGARNWTGSEYDGTLRPNAFGGRYYEPAPETEVYSGLELRFRR